MGFIDLVRPAPPLECTSPVAGPELIDLLMSSVILLLDQRFIESFLAYSNRCGKQKNRET
jgi:hypothetical protein